MKRTDRNLPYAGLVEWLQRTHDLRYTGYGTVAGLTGMSYGGVKRWHQTGIPMWTADRLAIKLGAHPADIWPKEWWERT